MNKALTWAIVIFGGLFVLFMLTAPTTKEAALSNATSVDTDGIAETDLFDTPPADLENKKKLIIGDASAPITLVEYGDFKCPACNSFHRGAGAQIRDEYVSTGKVKIEFRNYPFIGPDSGRAARGAYCSGEQGSFTEYHDAIYDYVWDAHYSGGSYAAEYYDIFTVDKIIEIAGGGVGDPAALRTCIESTDLDDSIDSDVVLASQDGVSGMPGFVLNGQSINGPQSYATFKALIEAQL